MFDIAFSHLWTYGEEDPTKRLALSALSDGGHVHGELRILVDGRMLPSLGYHGPDDTCFNIWIAELNAALERLANSNAAVHVFDEGEQGQPAFVFERDDARVLISVRVSAVSGARGDPEWEGVPCEFSAFAAAVASFLRAFREALTAEAGAERATAWWSRVSGSA